MKIQWTSHLKDPEDIERFTNQILHSKSVLERLSAILADRERAISSIETGVEIYRQPGWDAILAHYNGERAAIKYLKNLLNLDQEELNDPTRNIVRPQQ